MLEKQICETSMNVEPETSVTSFYELMFYTFK